MNRPHVNEGKMRAHKESLKAYYNGESSRFDLIDIYDGRIYSSAPSLYGPGITVHYCTRNNFHEGEDFYEYPFSRNTRLTRPTLFSSIYDLDEKYGFKHCGGGI